MTGSSLTIILEERNLDYDTWSYNNVKTMVTLAKNQIKLVGEQKRD